MKQHKMNETKLYLRILCYQVFVKSASPVNLDEINIRYWKKLKKIY